MNFTNVSEMVLLSFSLVTRPKQELRVEIRHTFGNYVFDSLAVLPPVFCIIIWVWHRNDADFCFIAKGFLKEEASSPGVCVFSDDIETAHGPVVFAKPLTQRDC